MMPAPFDAPLPLQLYTRLSSLVGPFVFPRVAKKLRTMGTAPERIEERKGYATQQRPEGRLLWCHAASVGESLSLLRLITHLGAQHGDLSFLLTSGTATSAQILADRLPPRTRHQFSPIDTPDAVRRFLRHWLPSAAIFVESELWPNMLRQAQEAQIPCALVNARMSNTSAKNWARAPATARHLMQAFRIIHCQDAQTAEHLRLLGLTHAEQGPNLKAMSPPLPFDIEEKSRLTDLIGKRSIWLASSTHKGEEEIMLQAHLQVLNTHPDALLILVPRHPERAPHVLGLAEKSGVRTAQRSRDEQLSPETQVYLADTLGETGLWYALSPITCLCGSFAPVGGHNPFEPAQGGSAILHGPEFANFAHIYEEFDAAGAAREVLDANNISEAILALLQDTSARTALTSEATKLLDAQNDGLSKIAHDLSMALELK